MWEIYVRNLCKIYVNFMYNFMSSWQCPRVSEPAAHQRRRRLSANPPSSVQLGLPQQGSMLYPLAVNRVNSAAQSRRRRTHASTAVQI